MSIVDDDIDTNNSSNPSIHDIIDRGLSRRNVIKMGGAAASLGFLGGLVGRSGSAGAVGTTSAPSVAAVPAASQLLGFSSVAFPAAPFDGVAVPPGYTAEVLLAWGDPISNGPAFLLDASQDWMDQEQQAGMHHDGLYFFSLPKGSNQNSRGLLCINHEYVDQGLLFPDGMTVWTDPDKVKKALAAHGVSIVEVRRRPLGRSTFEWYVRRPSSLARRITGSTPMDLVGPAAGSAYLQTAADPTGRRVLGTLNNCGSGITPWHTYLTCEENFNGYFGSTSAVTATPERARYGITAAGFGYRWHELDARFDVNANPNEPNRFGWVVEIDPHKPASTPKKLTALGRFKHEAAEVVLTRDGRPVVYSGDDERNNYIYKFVGKYPWRTAQRMGKSPLEEGKLYVAKFNDGPTTGDEMGTGEWVELTPSNAALVGKSIDWILVFTRMAADLVGATKMDRPEWIAAGRDGQVYCTLTNNSRRGRTTSNPSENPNSVPDDANPRSATNQGNPYGHIIRWREANGRPESTTFTWDLFALAGDPSNPGGLAPSGADRAPAEVGGNINGDMYGSPDGLWADRYGRLWIQTDISASALGAAAYANIPNNMMLAADPATGETKRFLVGPVNCEVTGVHMTPDGRAMFVSIQHPGEDPVADNSDPTQPRKFSNWPDYDANGRPRSATLVITKDNGGRIGS